MVVQADSFSASRLNNNNNTTTTTTTIAAAVTSNTVLAAMPGNVLLPAAVSGLPKDPVVNVTALVAD